MFGEWPSFHDAEVLAVRLDSGQRSQGIASLELDVHLFAVAGKRPDGGLNFVKHTVATLGFEGVDALQIEDFGRQNVLFDLTFEQVDLGHGREVQVDLDSSHGLAGRFRCREVAVLRVEPHEPGPHSVYGR